MDLKNKLDNLPSIYYVNLDNRIDRREYMENQFNFWNIKDFKRISASKYLASKFDDWKHLISNKSNLDFSYKIANIANFITHIEMIKDWLEQTDEKYFIMMEDDYDLSLIKHWNFDWNYLMNNIPYDWDCIQLGYESYDKINFFLHPKERATYFGPCMINRSYAEKLIRLYFDGSKYIIDNEKNDLLHVNNGVCNGDVDYSICQNGKTYCIPLIPQNPHIKSFEDSVERDDWDHVHGTYDAYYRWWNDYHHKFPLKDFFMYEKENDMEMTLDTRKMELISYS